MSEIHQTEEEIRQHEEELDHFKMTQFLRVEIQD